MLGGWSTYDLDDDWEVLFGISALKDGAEPALPNLLSQNVPELQHMRQNIVCISERELDNLCLV